MPGATTTPSANEWRGQEEVQMVYQSPADFCAKYAKAHNRDQTDGSGDASALDSVTVVSETPDTARIEALWYTCGHEPDSGYWDVFERTAFVLVKRHDGWRLHSEENLGYE
jgi:ketosteroid isomerase-like protein